MSPDAKDLMVGAVLLLAFIAALVIGIATTDWSMAGQVGGCAK